MSLWTSSEDRVGDFPGPQRRRRRARALPSLLYSLIVVAILLTVFAIVKANLYSEEWSYQRLWKLELLDTKSSITILVSLLGLLVVTNKFVRSFSPYIAYDSCFSAESSFGLSSAENKFWSVTVKNAGLGTAVIDRTFFEFSFGGNDREQHSADYSTVIGHFGQNGLVYEEDFSLMRVSKGYAISAKETACIFEIPAEHLSRIFRLDIRYEYRSFLGERYYKDIYCVPHRKAESMTTTQVNK